jgi:penicillin-binding protein A
MARRKVPFTIGVFLASTFSLANTARSQVPVVSDRASSSHTKYTQPKISSRPFNEASISAISKGPQGLSQVEISSRRPYLTKVPKFDRAVKESYVSRFKDGSVAYYTINQEIQRYLEGIIRNSRAPHLAAVVMEPKSGKILALSGKSRTLVSPLTHSGYPAASLFKVITAAAAVDTIGIDTFTNIKFRGGDYTLNRYNYLPNSRSDRRLMSVGMAMGKSCNPVFGRIGLKLNSPSLLRDYVSLFKFNSNIPSDILLPLSRAVIPNNSFELSRTSAGFGEVRLSPVHAATFMSAVANGGTVLRPLLIDKLQSAYGQIVYQAKSTSLGRALNRVTSSKLLELMSFTTTHGTAKNEFMAYGRKRLPYDVAGKTGTLRGSDPKGLTQWFIATAPINDPKVVVSIVSVDGAGVSDKPTRIGRLLIEQYLKQFYPTSKR